VLVFLTWSGPESKQISAALRLFLKRVLQAVDPWVSYEDIPSGAVWTAELEEKLDASHAGIICVTPTNIEAPWLHYEVGKLSKTRATVSPYLFRVSEANLVGALSGRQAITQAEDKNQNKKLVLDLLALLRAKEGSTLKDEHVLEQFDVWWPSHETALASVSAPPTKERDSRELLDEILVLARETVATVKRTESALRSCPKDPAAPVGGASGSAAPTAPQPPKPPAPQTPGGAEGRLALLATLEKLNAPMRQIQERANEFAEETARAFERIRSAAQQSGLAALTHQIEEFAAPARALQERFTAMVERDADMFEQLRRSFDQSALASAASILEEHQRFVRQTLSGLDLLAIRRAIDDLS
jgi:hypothetical protein